MPGFFVLLEATRPRLSRSANGYFQIPTGRVVEVGTQVTIQGVSPSIPTAGRPITDSSRPWRHVRKARMSVMKSPGNSK